MNRRLVPLIRIADLLRDRDLAALSDLARARRANLDRLAALKAAPEAGPFSVGGAQARLRYEAWADGRRAEINASLARQAAALAEAEDRARRTLGRAEALRALSARPR